jgi:hypothetical protein
MDWLRRDKASQLLPISASDDVILALPVNTAPRDSSTLAVPHVFVLGVAASHEALDASSTHPRPQRLHHSSHRASLSSLSPLPLNSARNLFFFHILFLPSLFSPILSFASPSIYPTPSPHTHIPHHGSQRYCRGRRPVWPECCAHHLPRRWQRHRTGQAR